MGANGTAGTTGTTVRAEDGRELRVAEWGAPRGVPVMFLHGTPGCRLYRYSDEAMLTRTGVRLVTYDRPGYGRSDRQLGRTVASAAADVRAIAGHLGIDRLPVYGYSGGGPHALACAALLPGLVPRAAAVSGIAPADATGLDWLDGMTQLNLEEFAAAAAGPEALTEALDPAARQAAADPEQLTAELEAELPPADVEVLRRPEVREIFTATVAEGLRDGGAGWIDDDLAFLKPWGFDVAAIDVPVSLWHGGADNLAPRSHAAWLAGAIPGADFRDLAGIGHMGMYDHHPAVVDWLLRT